MRIVVIGGTGHVGTFLIPRLVASGHDVVCLSRGTRQPYVSDPSWSQVELLSVDREAEDAAGTFGATVAALEADVVIDLVCFTVESAVALVEGLRGRVDHLIHCGSIWMHGLSLKLPITEDNGSEPFGDYGVQKAAIARLLQQETQQGGLVTTSLHPGHISGPGWPVINPVGNLDPGVWEKLAAGQELVVPGLGAELMHHVHADDVAQAFALAVEHRAEASGEAFNVTAASALTVRGFARFAAGWFGLTPQLRSVSWAEFRAQTTTEWGDSSWEHLSRSQYASIDKATRLLGYQPRYEPEEAAREAVGWMVEHQQLQLARPLIS
ncbi:MAG: NAD-dependent epimerase/dehydratase family protein [Propionibacteriaceae bacterium]